MDARFYARQRGGAEMIAWGNAFVKYDDDQWAVARAVTLPGPVVASSAIREFELSSPTGRLLVWGWYEVNGRQVASDSLAKALSAWSLLTGRGDASMVVTIATRNEASVEETRRRLEAVRRMVELERTN